MQIDIYREILVRAESLKSRNSGTQALYLKKLFDLLNLGFINYNIEGIQTVYRGWQHLQLPTLNEEQKAQGSWECSGETKKQQFFQRCQNLAKPLIVKPPAHKSWWQKVVDFISPNRVLAEKHIEERANDFKLLKFFTTQLSRVTSADVAARGERLWQDIHLLTDMVTQVNSQINFYEEQSQRYTLSLFGGFAWGMYQRQKHQCQLLKKKMKTHLKNYIKQLKAAQLIWKILPQSQKEAVLAQVKNLEKKCRTMGIREDFSILKKHLVKLYLSDFLKPRLRAAGESGDEGRVFPKSLMDLARDLKMEGVMATIKSVWELNADQMPPVQVIQEKFKKIFNAEHRLLTQEEEEILQSFIAKLCQKINCEKHTCYQWLVTNYQDSKQLENRKNTIEGDKRQLLSELHGYIVQGDDEKAVFQLKEEDFSSQLLEFLTIETILRRINNTVNTDYHGHSETAWPLLQNLYNECLSSRDVKDETSSFLYKYTKKRCLFLFDNDDYINALGSAPMNHYYDLIADDTEVQNKLGQMIDAMPTDVTNMMSLCQVVNRYGGQAAKQKLWNKFANEGWHEICSRAFLSENQFSAIPDVYLRQPDFQEAFKDFIVSHPLDININALMNLQKNTCLADAIDEVLNDLFDESLRNFVHPNNNPDLSRQLDGIAKAYDSLTQVHAHRSSCWHYLSSLRFGFDQTQGELQGHLNRLLNLLPSEPQKHALEYFLMLLQVHCLNLTPAQKNQVKSVYKNFLRANMSNFEPCQYRADQFHKELLQPVLDFNLVKHARCLPAHSRTYTPPPSPRKASSPGTRFRSGGVDWDSKSLPRSGGDDGLDCESEKLISSSTGSSLLESDSFGSDSRESKSDTDHWVSVPASLRPARSCGEGNRNKTIQSAEELIAALQKNERRAISSQAESLVGSYRKRGMVDREMLFWDVIAEYFVGAIRGQNYGGKNFNQWCQKVEDCFFNALLSAPGDVPPHFLLSIMTNYRVNMYKLSQLKANLEAAFNDHAFFIPQNITREVDYFRCVLVAGLAENDTFFAELVNCLQKLSGKIGSMPHSGDDIKDWVKLNREIKDVLAMTATVQ